MFVFFLLLFLFHCDCIQLDLFESRRRRRIVCRCCCGRKRNGKRLFLCTETLLCTQEMDEERATKKKPNQIWHIHREIGHKNRLFVSVFVQYYFVLKIHQCYNSANTNVCHTRNGDALTLRYRFSK